MRGKEDVVVYLDFATAFSEAHQKKLAGAALNFHLTDDAVRFDSMMYGLVSYFQGIDHSLTFLIA